MSIDRTTANDRVENAHRLGKAFVEHISKPEHAAERKHFKKKLSTWLKSPEVKEKFQEARRNMELSNSILTECGVPVIDDISANMQIVGYMLNINVEKMTYGEMVDRVFGWHLAEQHKAKLLSAAMKIQEKNGDEENPGEKRLQFDDITRTAYLDGIVDKETISPNAYQFLKAIGKGDRCGRMIAGPIVAEAPGLSGKKLSRVLDQLPNRWKKLISSRPGSGGGYCLTLPPKKSP
jgi:hypothetical protein